MQAALWSVPRLWRIAGKRRVRLAHQCRRKQVRRCARRTLQIHLLGLPGLSRLHG
jgi:hypothetical protein